jgi:hypothetical protein
VASKGLSSWDVRLGNRVTTRIDAAPAVRFADGGGRGIPRPLRRVPPAVPSAVFTPSRVNANRRSKEMS